MPGERSLPYAVWALLVLALIVYGAAVRCRRDSLKPWSPWRTVSFAAGLLILAFAVLPELPGADGSAARGHMISHVLLAMVAPIAVVLGCPATLALQALPRNEAQNLARLLRSRPARVLTRPLVAVMLNVGTMFLLYLTPVYGMVHGQPVVVALLHLHFFLAGYLFVWVVANEDRVPGQASFLVRLGALGVSAAAHAYLAKLMYAGGWPRGTGESVEHVRAAAQLMYYGGDLAELLLAVALFSQWYSHRWRLPAQLVPQSHARVSDPETASA